MMLFLSAFRGLRKPLLSRVPGKFPTLIPAIAASLLAFNPSEAAAEDGYDLWLRYRKVGDPVKLRAYENAIREIHVEGDSPTANAIRSELERGLSGLLGRKIPSVPTPTGGGTVIVGTPDTSRVVAGLKWDEALRDLGNDGFLLRSGVMGGQPVIVVAANTETGALYGAFTLLRTIQTGGSIEKLNIAQKPAFQRRILNHWDNLDGSIERGYAGKSLWRWDELPGTIDPRYTDYARANASIGINGAVLNNVNAKAEQLDAEHLKKAAAIADALRPYGVRVYLTAKWSAPKQIGGLPDANPSNPEVRKWWKEKADEIYALIPDFGGFLVKANSEGQPGPQDYDKTHADGANMLAEALEPHGGVVMWRAFVYNSPKVDPDRAKRAYLEFIPFEGKFSKNVFVQPKTGPVDFQPREPFHPLFGAMPKTPLMPELQITQENKGHSTHLVYLGPEWEEFFNSDTDGKGTTVAAVVTNSEMTGIAGVANTGSDRNWTGHDFAQANWFAFGRLAWDPKLTADEIAREWIRMTWSHDPKVVDAIAAMMKGSWQANVDYEMPLGIHHIMDAGSHYTPKPHTVNKEAPEYSAYYYHKADAKGIGFDRTKTGSDAVSQYAPAIRDRFADLATCPEDLILWFHHVPWEHRMKSGRNLWDELVFRYYGGVEYVKDMQQQWEALRGKVDDERHSAVSRKLEKHLKDAREWRDVCVKYFQEQSGRELPSGLPKD